MVSDFITDYMDHTSEIASPEIFRLWCAIGAVAGALERRCWVRTRKGGVYPNLFTLLVASPGIGKTEAIKITEELWYDTRKLIVSPKSLTKAALIDCLKEALQTKTLSNGQPYEYHSLLVPSTELGSLLSAHDMEFLSTLNDLYDNPKVYKEKRRHFNAGKDTEIIAPQINILAGTQPGFMAHILPEEAWSMGFTSRIVMVYAGTPPANKSLWDDPGTPLEGPSNKGLVARLSHFADLGGQFRWTAEAHHVMDKWYQGGLQPTPEHSKLVHYLPRRILHALKLCMVSAVSRTHTLEIDIADVTRAQDWLITAENAMPDIFREMVQRSDADVVTELHFMMWRIFIQPSNKQKPIHQSTIWNFLKNRVPSEKIPRIIDLAEKAHIIDRVAGSFELWVPKPKQHHGVE